jgi:arginase family enzyme
MEFLNPIPKNIIEFLELSCSKKSLFYSTNFNSKIDDLTKNKIAIIGINDDRVGVLNNGTSKSADEIRKEFYQLIKHRNDISIVDLGNIEAGNTINDTYYAVKQTLAALIKKHVLCLIIGANEDFIHTQYAAYENTQFNMNVLIADARVALNFDDENEINNGYISKIIAHQKNYLFNITHVGHQSYFVETESYDAFEKMNFDMLRLGLFRNKIHDIEPFCRNADMMAFNLSAIKAADAHGQRNPSANGFTGEEACQISRYAGMSNDLKTFGIYNLNPAKDINNLTSQLVAQMLWYFIDGYNNRKIEYPTKENNDFLVYYTSIQGSYDITFYKNNMSDRWWMEVPYPKNKSDKSGSFMVPCNYSDYKIALSNEIPDRWIKAYQKLI